MNLSRKDKANFESIFGGNDIFSTIYIIGDSISVEMIVDKINSAVNASFLASCSTLPNNSGIIVRILANSVSEIVTLAEHVTDILRSFTEKNSPITSTTQNSSVNIV